MRPPALRQNASKRWLIPVEPGKPKRPRHSGNDGWRVTAQLLRLQASNNRPAGRTRPKQRAHAARRHKKAPALALVTLLAIAGLYLNLLTPGEVVTMLVAAGWLPMPKGP